MPAALASDEMTAQLASVLGPFLAVGSAMKEAAN